MRRAFGWSTAAVMCLPFIAFGQNVREAAPTREGVKAGKSVESRREAQPGQDAKPGREGRQGKNREGGRGAQAMAGQSDQQIAACIHGGCRNEIEISKFAQSKAKSESTKQFAAKMVEEHTAGCEKMGQLAGNLAAHADGSAAAHAEGRAAAAPREGVRATEASAPAAGQGTQATPAARTAGRGGMGTLNWVQIHKELADKCLASTKKELGSYEGDDFDKAYMGQQIVAHMEMIDKLTVLRNHASSQLQQEIDKSIEMGEKHLAEAREIMNKEKDQGSEGQSGAKAGSPAAKGTRSEAKTDRK